MIDSELFIKRLEKIIHFYGMSASQLADRIGVQRSSISHLLTGRNKPSLEFVMKLVTGFPEVNFYWLLYGQGSFPEEKSKNYLPSPENKDGNSGIIATSHSVDNRIKRVIIFYKDGSFEAYENDVT